jgi:hypothetical protein
MKVYSLVLLALQASSMPAQPVLQTLPGWATNGIVEGDWSGIAVAGKGKVCGDAGSVR